MFKKYLKNIGIIILIACAIGGSTFAYDYYQTYQEKEKELAFLVNPNDKPWQWDDELFRVQSRVSDKTNRTVLRKVYLRGGYSVEVFKLDDYSVAGVVSFKAACEPKTEIETSKKYRSGKPIKLFCNNAGSALKHGAKWGKDDYPLVTWSNNFDGFKFSSDLVVFDFDKLDREITLLKSTKISGS